MTPKPSAEQPISSQQATADDLPIASKTTSEEDKHTLIARRINMIWEVTQAAIAALVIGATIYVAARIALGILAPNATDTVVNAANIAFMLLSNMASIIIGFYFGRTNHARQGGVITPTTPKSET